jgi:hypothetical protein
MGHYCHEGRERLVSRISHPVIWPYIRQRIGFIYTPPGITIMIMGRRCAIWAPLTLDHEAYTLYGYPGMIRTEGNFRINRVRSTD